MVSCVFSRVDLLMKQSIVLGWVLMILLSSGCRSGCHRDHSRPDAKKLDKIEKTVLGDLRIGNELESFYIAYGFDSAILGFSVSIGAGPARYFPIYGSTDRGIPSVTLEVFASKSEEEMWVRSSWRDNEILAYHRVGAETAIGEWGEMKFVEEPMPDFLSGGPFPFPVLTRENVVKKATFIHNDDE